MKLLINFWLGYCSCHNTSRDWC